MLSSCERVGWATQQQRVGLALQRQRALALEAAGDARSAPATRRSRTAPPRRRSAGRRSPARAWPRRRGRRGRARASALDQRPRIAAVAAEAAGVDDRRAGTGRAGRCGVGRRPAPAPGPSRSGSAAGSAIPRRREVRRPPARETQTTASAAPSQRRSSRASSRRWAAVGKSGRSDSNVHASRTSATHGTPRRCSARPTACADSGGEVVITQSKRALATQPQRPRARERHPGRDQRLGHQHAGSAGAGGRCRWRSRTSPRSSPCPPAGRASAGRRRVRTTSSAASAAGSP